MNASLNLLILTLGVIISANTAFAVRRTQSFDIPYNEMDFSFSVDENGYLMIHPEDLMASYSEDNEPCLPFFSTVIAIPNNDKYVSSSVEFTKRLIRSNIQLAQSPLPVATD
ncbi:MAG: hypothetical protein NC336_09365, partial [Clostridium sp.]|nr:hypothetical protein [Clostridium sp.]